MSEILWLALLSPLVGMVAMMALNTRRRPPLSSGPGLPAAEETAQSVRRFQEAADRYMMTDFIWERYSQGRGLLTDDLAENLRLKKSPRRKANQAKPPKIPQWL